MARRGGQSPPETPGQSPLVRLACADDDAQGQSLDVFWDYELDRRILEEEGWQDLAAKGFDPPRQFAAFLHTLRWNCVTATDPNLFQAPFRAGIKIDAYQMEPLRKALRLPRVNLFIADDTGPRQDDRGGPDRARAAPAQEGEDHRRRGAALGARAVEGRARGALRPRLRDPRPRLPDADAPRARLRREPLAHAQPLPGLAQPADRPDLRRPDARVARADAAGQPADPRRGAPRRARRAAGATASRPSSRAPIRDLAGRFEHRLFLSATPHNGHSNSFSTLLELLDPYRFTRGVKVRGKKALEDVMVRRLKEDIREVQGGFPKRNVVRVAIDGLPDDAPELVLSRLLDEYRTAREERFASTSRRAQAAAGLLVVGLAAAPALVDRGVCAQPQGPPGDGGEAVGEGAGSREPTRRRGDGRASGALHHRPRCRRRARRVDGRGARGRGGRRRSRRSPPRRKPSRHAMPTAEALWRREQALLDQMQEIAEKIAVRARRQDPPAHRLDPREPLPGAAAVRQRRRRARPRSGTTAAS